jgi:hypothetical protein
MKAQSGDSIMLEFVPSLLKPDSFWRRTWRFLCTLDEAVHTSEMDILVAHVARLECELKELKSRAYAAASVPDRPLARNFLPVESATSQR